jgi:hypothetical protein
MCAIEPIRPIYFWGHSLVIEMLRILNLLPTGQSLGHIIVVIPVCGVATHSLLIVMGGLIGGKLAIDASRGVVIGAAICVMFLLIVNVAIAACGTFT